MTSNVSMSGGTANLNGHNGKSSRAEWFESVTRKRVTLWDGGTAAMYLRVGAERSQRGKLISVDPETQQVEVSTRIEGKSFRESIEFGSLVDLVDPAGTTWTRRGLGI